MVVLPWKCTCIPYLPHICLMLLAIPFVYGMKTCPTVVLFPLLLLFGLFPELLLCVMLLLLSLDCVDMAGSLLLLFGLAGWLLFVSSHCYLKLYVVLY